MRRIDALAVQFALLASFGLTGCCYYELRDCYDECLCNLRNECLARRAWHRSNDAFDNHPHKKEFGHGFRDGYAAVAGGADGCCPSMPPRCYWGTCYRDCDGLGKVNAWFDGYARGAIAAEADGLTSCGRIVVRPPACPPGCEITPGHVHGMSVPAPALPQYPVGPAPPPPPAAPSLTPAVPADEAYESYNEGGLYYE